MDSIPGEAESVLRQTLNFEAVIRIRVATVENVDRNYRLLSSGISPDLCSSATMSTPRQSDASGSERFKRTRE